MRKFLFSLAAAAVVFTTPVLADIFPGSSGRYLSDGELSALSCGDLWVARNEIYARNGYCFKTRRGRNYFGNAGCYTSNPPLNRIERANVARIQRWERRCRAGGPAPAPGGGGGGGGLWGLSCQRLWVMRNQIYKNNGYCFRTRRARNFFGNAGCWTSNPRLSRAERARVNAIRRVERAKGCR